jgi:hypothetical protein
MTTRERGEAKVAQQPNPEFPEEAQFFRELDKLVYGCVAFQVQGVTGESGRLAHGFTPTRYELEVLAQHYAQEVSDIHARWLEWGSSGSYEIRFGPFAQIRLKGISDIIGEDRLNFLLRGLRAYDEVFLKGGEELCKRRGVECLVELYEPEMDPEARELCRRAEQAREDALRRRA